MKLVECVPNFSEGRRPHVVEQIRKAIADVPGASVLDVSSDASHNRTVVTFVASVEAAGEAAFAAIRSAASLIDLREHSGAHPRIGATDVVPFVPLEGATMEECVALARALGERVGRELAIPVYLYERAATRPARANLADVRRGEFEGLRDIIGTDPDRAPDFGPARVHPGAGAIAIGARPFLVAYNVYLGPATNLPVAKAVAKAVRASSGGLPYVKALGLEVDGQAQVSMNLVDTDSTPLQSAYEAVRADAAAHGVTPTWSEIVGLVPEGVILDTATRSVQLRGFSADQILERRLRTAAAKQPAMADFVRTVAAPTPTPGGGSVVALVGALAAALAEMVAGLTVGRPKYAAADAQVREVGTAAAGELAKLMSLVDRDAKSYEAVVAAHKMPKTLAEARNVAIASALTAASEVPLETARACARIAELAAVAAESGNPNAVSDAGVAALLAQAAARGAAYNVRINVSAMADPETGRSLAAEAERLVADATRSADRATAAVEKRI